VDAVKYWGKIFKCSRAYLAVIFPKAAFLVTCIKCNKNVGICCGAAAAQRIQGLHMHMERAVPWVLKGIGGRIPFHLCVLKYTNSLSLILSLSINARKDIDTTRF
jgi:hypothetical protein